MSPSAALKASKGEETRAQILAAAVEQASTAGFESLTIGTLADKIGMSKSGLFAHFGSKQELQIAALDEAARRFIEFVWTPAMGSPRGLRRMRAIFENMLGWTARAGLPGGCPIDAATREYRHQPGPLRDAVIARQKQLDNELAKCVRMAVENNELSAQTDAQQFAFEVMGISLAFFRTEPVLGALEASKRARTAFERLIEQNLPQ